MVDEGAHNFTLASRLASTFECSHKEVPVRLPSSPTSSPLLTPLCPQALLDSLREGSDVYTSHSAAVISEALCVVRSVVQCHKTTLAMQNRRVFNVLGIRFTLGTDIAQRDLELLDPVLKHGHKLRTLGLSMYNDSDGKLPSFPLDEPFYTKLCHHLLVYHTLLFRQVLEAKRGAPTDTLQQYLEVSAKRLQEIFWIAKRKDERLAAPLEEILGRAALEGGVEILMKRS